MNTPAGLFGDIMNRLEFPTGTPMEARRLIGAKVVVYEASEGRAIVFASSVSAAALCVDERLSTPPLLMVWLEVAPKIILANMECLVMRNRRWFVRRLEDSKPFDIGCTVHFVT